MPSKLYNKTESKDIRRSLRQQNIGAEKVLWLKLRNRQQGYKFRRQFGIGDYVVDFYCPEARLVVEVDGATHSTPDEIAKDETRQHQLEAFGTRVLRINNSDVYKNIDEVLECIQRICRELILKTDK